MSVAGRKLTIRMPDNRRLRGAEVVGIHVDPGGRVREGNPVMTIRAGHGEHRIRAPRPGRAIPLVTVGDEVLGGDPLFILNLDENALVSQKSRSKRTMLGRGVEAFTTAKREGMAAEAPVPRPDRKWQYDEAMEDGWTWLKPGLAILVYLMACFALLPVFRQLGAGASPFEVVIMMGIAVLIAALMAVFLMPSYGRWPRVTVRLVSLSWLVLVAGVMFPQMMKPRPPLNIAGAGGDDRSPLSRAGDATRGQRPGQAPRQPLAITRSGVLVGQTDLVPMPRHTLPSRLPTPTDRVVPHDVRVASSERLPHDPDGGKTVPAIAGDPTLSDPKALTQIAETGSVTQLAEAPAIPADLPQSDAEGLLRLAAQDPASAVASGSAPVLTGTDAGSAVDAPAIAGTALRVGPFAATMDGRGFRTGLDADVTAGIAGTPNAVTDPIEQASLPKELPGPASVAVLLGVGTGASGATDEALSGAHHLAAAPGRLDMPARFDPTGAPDPVAVTDRRLADAEWMGAQIGRSGGVREAERAAPPADWQPVRQSTAVSVPAAVAEIPATLPGSAPVTPARAGRLAAVELGGDAAPVVAGLRSRPGPTRSLDGLQDPGAPDPVMIAAMRAGDAGWMQAQSERAGSEQGLLSARKAVGDQPTRTTGSELAGAGDRIGAEPRIDGMSARGRLDDQDRRDVPELVGGTTDAVADAASVDGASAGDAPVLAAISPEMRGADGPEAIPDVPPVGPKPATRMVLYLFFDDPRLETRPELGGQWAAELPPDVARGVWSNRVVAVHEIIQVETWCEGKGPDAGQAWLNDRLRLLQVRVDMDPAVLPAFERALPLFEGAPPGFFHNRRPLLGGGPDADLIERARSFLRETHGDQFFDSAQALTAAMERGGCARAVWNGGAGPANALGAQLSRRFGS